ncbi:TPA: hypothetical protein ACHYZ9_004445 [Pseudomonas aeruginosa]
MIPNLSHLKYSPASDPLELKEYLKAPRDTGCYIIGEKFESEKPVVRNDIPDDYLPLGFPDNFRPIYVGISESKKSGMRSRLSCHSRKKGNKVIKKYIEEGKELYFIYFTGEYMAYQLEAMMECLRAVDNPIALQFEANIRSEFTRSAYRTRRTFPVKFINNLPEDYDPRRDHM